MKTEYLHQNPVVEVLVFNAKDYVYSSLIDNTGESELMEVISVK